MKHLSLGFSAWLIIVSYNNEPFTPSTTHPIPYILKDNCIAAAFAIEKEAKKVRVPIKAGCYKVKRR